ncbi:MAG: DUF2203 family protein [Planctomycetaceae bacterium]
MTAEDIILTVQQVNQRLPLVRAIVRDVVGLKADVVERQSRLQELRDLHPVSESEQTPWAEEVTAMQDGLAEDELRLIVFESELEDVGGILADARVGLVEFASEIDGRSVVLSWLPGESEVSYWRELSDAITERRPLLQGVADMTVQEFRAET